MGKTPKSFSPRATTLCTHPFNTRVKKGRERKNTCASLSNCCFVVLARGEQGKHWSGNDLNSFQIKQKRVFFSFTPLFNRVWRRGGGGGRHALLFFFSTCLVFFPPLSAVLRGEFRLLPPPSRFSRLVQVNLSTKKSLVASLSCKIQFPGFFLSSVTKTD